MVQLLTRRKIGGLNPLLTFRCNLVEARFYSAAAIAVLLTIRIVQSTYEKALDVHCYYGPYHMVTISALCS